MTQDISADNVTAWQKLSVTGGSSMTLSRAVDSQSPISSAILATNGFPI
jgi:hypothetical protein